MVGLTGDEDLAKRALSTREHRDNVWCKGRLIFSVLMLDCNNFISFLFASFY